MPPYGRANSPQHVDVRPLMDDRTTSPASGPPRPAYSAHPSNSVPPPPPPPPPSSMVGGPPPPDAGFAAAEAAARERHDRTPSAAAKRAREWSDDNNNNAAAKKVASDENRAALEEPHHRRPSPANKLPSPHELHRRSPSDMRRPEDSGPPPSRRGEDGGGHHHHHHLSQDAGGPHPHSLPPMNTAYGPMGPGPLKEEPRRDDHEPAARKMEVDEDYDDDGADEDQKRGPGIPSHAGISHERTSPPSSHSVHASNGMVNGLPKTEV